jgi:hypothetical protein
MLVPVGEKVLLLYYGILQLGEDLLKNDASVINVRCGALTFPNFDSATQLIIFANEAFPLVIKRPYPRRELSYEHTPCGGGIEYLHRDPASRRRRQKGKSQM